jgi:hypothetical protein
VRDTRVNERAWRRAKSLELATLIGHASLRATMASAGVLAHAVVKETGEPLGRTDSLLTRCFWP